MIRTLRFVFSLLLPLVVCACSANRTPAPTAAIEQTDLPLHAPAAARNDGGRTIPALHTAAPASASDIRVMSFNLRVSTLIDGLNHWNFRRELLLATIQKFNPDLLGTQEGLAGQLDWLKQRLPEYQFVGVGRKDGKRKGEMCGIFFRTDKYELIEEGHFWLSKNPYKPGSRSWGSAFPRMASWVKLRPKQGGQMLVFLNTHFDNIGSRARLESAHLVRDQLTSIAGGMPTIITGDFNTDENTPPYTALLGSRELGMKFIDTFRAANPQPQREQGTRHGFRGGARGDRIDWILTTTAFHTVAAEIDRTRRGLRYPSDHFPVSAVVRPMTEPAVANIE